MLNYPVCLFDGVGWLVGWWMDGGKVKEEAEEEVKEKLDMRW